MMTALPWPGGVQFFWVLGHAAGISKGWQQSLLDELKKALDAQATDVLSVHFARDTIVHGLLETRQAIASLPEEYSPSRHDIPCIHIAICSSYRWHAHCWRPNEQ